jgi:hypothetical protein
MLRAAGETVKPVHFRHGIEECCLASLVGYEPVKTAAPETLNVPFEAQFSGTAEVERRAP